MRLGRKLLVFAAFAALATLLIGGPQAAAVDPIHPGDCWDIHKVAKNAQGQTITEVTLSLGQTFTIYYEITVTERDCAAGEVPHESVDVRDSFAGSLAIHLNHSETFRYTRDVVAHECGEFDVRNTAEVLNAVVLDSASVTVHVTVACDEGCTLTQGYWKTHSREGPAPFDNTWALLPGGLQEDTIFFLSGQTWFQVFWTSPSGNAYYQLAHQYMAARLNILNGASAPAAVNTAIASATTLFNTYTPAQIGALKGSDPLRAQFISLAGTLASYNEGAIGPGHCDE